MTLLLGPTLTSNIYRIDEHVWRSPTSTHPLSPSSIIVPRDIYSHQSYLPNPTHLASPLNYGYPNQARNVFPGLHYPLVSPTEAVYTQAQMPAMGGYGNTAAECADFPWPSRDLIHTMVCEDGTEVVGTVFSKMEKGFFRNVSDGGWTCYRRNYFAATSWYELSPHIANSKLFINGRMVQALGMRLSAIVDGPGGKSIELIQHTPKRDLGPKESVRAYRVLPTPPAGRQVEHTLSPRGVYQVPVPSFHATGFPSTPFLPRQYEADTPPGSSAASPASRGSSSNSFSSAARTQAQGQSVSHTFERLQFKSATANNGKRRASQQFFILVVELVADIRGEGELHPRWQRVALRFSDKLIVRGRSPSHYKDELLRVPNYGRGGHGGGGYGGPSGTYAPTPLAGFTTIASNYGTHPGNTGGFRAVHQYSHHASPDTEASPASVEDPSADVKYPLESQDALEDEDTMHNEAGYQQIYDGRLVKDRSPITLPSITYLDNGNTSQYPFHGEYNYNQVHHWDPTTNGRHQDQQPGPGYYPGAGDPYDM